MNAVNRSRVSVLSAEYEVPSSEDLRPSIVVGLGLARGWVLGFAAHVVWQQRYCFAAYCEDGLRPSVEVALTQIGGNADTLLVQQLWNRIDYQTLECDEFYRYPPLPVTVTDLGIADEQESSINLIRAAELTALPKGS